MNIELITLRQKLVFHPRGVYVNGALKATDTTSPYSFAWAVPSKPRVSYQIQAKAYDAAGNVGVSGIVKVTAK